ncbi:MAG: thiamine-phosphate kinase, partial [Synergistales bacterium]|nr:thiamine-phosphate kinase [Synergistales bacterium]
MPALKELGEREILRRITAQLEGHATLQIGIGDDAAVATPPPGMDLVLTTDPVIEGVHFERGTPGQLIGSKVAGRCLSDLAAMGAQPLWFLLNLVAPETESLDQIAALME